MGQQEASTHKKSPAANAKDSTATATATATASSTINATSTTQAASAAPHQSTADQKFEAVVVSGIDEVDAREWDALVEASCRPPEQGGTGYNPFISHAFLLALESSNSASPRKGWAPQHLLLYAAQHDDEQQQQQSVTGGHDGTNSAAEHGSNSSNGGNTHAGSRSSRAGRGRLLGAVPLYLKAHSYGEYVFDSSWANLASMLGQRYYPKLQSCVPFSPVTGPRLLTRVPPGPERNAVIKALGVALRKLADGLGVSSVHVTFNTAEEAALLEPLGFMTRCGIQFHWENTKGGEAGEGAAAAAALSHSADAAASVGSTAPKSENNGASSSNSNGLNGAHAAAQQQAGLCQPEGAGLQQQQQYTSFEDFLSSLRQSKRKSIRQERKSVAAQGLRVRRLTGDTLRAAGRDIWAKFHLFHTDTVERKWGTPYLTQEFFQQLGETLADKVLLVVAEEESSGEMVAASLNLIGSHTLYGRNWGCAPDRTFRGLHFECCYYQALEEAMRRSLARVEAGAQGEHKLQRGYLPSLTYSSHYIRDLTLAHAVAKFLAREQVQIVLAWEQLTKEASPYKQDGTRSRMQATLAQLSKANIGSLSDTLETVSSFSSLDDDE